MISAVGRGLGIVACCAIVTTATGACGTSASFVSPDPDASTSSPGAPAPGQCPSVSETDAPWIQAIANHDPAPQPAGGLIVPGRYILTQVNVSADNPSFTPVGPIDTQLRGTLTVSPYVGDAGVARYSFALEISEQGTFSGRFQESRTILDVRGGDSSSQGIYLTGDLACPAPTPYSPSMLSVPYTALPRELHLFVTIYEGTADEVFVLQ